MRKAESFDFETQCRHGRWIAEWEYRGEPSALSALVASALVNSALYRTIGQPSKARYWIQVARQWRAARTA